MLLEFTMLRGAICSISLKGTVVARCSPIEATKASDYLQPTSVSRHSIANMRPPIHYPYLCVVEFEQGGSAGNDIIIT